MILIKLVICLLPWLIKRRVLSFFFGYRLSPDARIGYAFVFPRRLEMEAGASIGNLTVVQGISLLRMEHASHLGRLNWVSGFPKGPSKHFEAEPEREPSLIIRRHAAITNRHLIDCSGRVEIGEFSTFAGFRSQILTHSIDLHEGRQATRPISIGAYCFVGTGCILLPGARLPDRSVLAAGSVLTRTEVEDPSGLYAGAPAKFKKPLPADWRYFNRTEGFVW